MKKTDNTTKQDFPVSACAICGQKTSRYQLAVFDQIEFWACHNCESVTTAPLPTTKYITEALNSSLYAKKSVFSHARERKIFQKHLTDLKAHISGQSFIDVFCRSGGRVELARINGFPTAKGIDTNQYCLEVAQKRFHKADFENSTVEQLAQTGEKFDIVCSAHGLESTENPDTYIKELKKLMNDDGYLYLSLCDGNHFMIPQNFLRWKELRYPERAHYISRKGLRQFLKRHDLQITKHYFRFLPYQHVIAKQVKH